MKTGPDLKWGMGLWKAIKSMQHPATLRSGGLLRRLDWLWGKGCLSWCSLLQLSVSLSHAHQTFPFQVSPASQNRVYCWTISAFVLQTALLAETLQKFRMRPGLEPHDMQVSQKLAKLRCPALEQNQASCKRRLRNSLSFRPIFIFTHFWQSTLRTAHAFPRKSETWKNLRVFCGNGPVFAISLQKLHFVAFFGCFGGNPALQPCTMGRLGQNGRNQKFFSQSTRNLREFCGNLAQFAGILREFGPICGNFAGILREFCGNFLGIVGGRHLTPKTKF